MRLLLRYFNLYPKCETLSWSQVKRTFYDARTSSDTIFALATEIESRRGSPLGIIRVSGRRIGFMIEKLTSLRLGNYNENADLEYDERKHGENQRHRQNIKPRYATLSKIYDPATSDLIDIGLILWFKGPDSYTGEDVCEFHLHGSRAITSRLLDVLGKFEGCRPAEPGEFTRRAVKNGKMSLIQAESIPELIASRTDNQRKLALTGLLGSTRRRYDSWHSELMSVLAHLEASIDFGEDELIGEEQVVSECLSKLAKLSEELKRFIDISSRCREFIKSGARLAILGQPNVGKSSLMNMLCRQDKSIVSNLSGTTRDIIEHSIQLDGHLLTISDTAGLRDLSSLSAISSSLSPSAAIVGGANEEQENEEDENGEKVEMTVMERHNLIEREGIRRALLAARKSNLVLYLIDAVRLASSMSGLEGIQSELVTTFEALLGERNDIEQIHLLVNKIDLCESEPAGGCVQLESNLKKLEQFLRDKPRIGEKLAESLSLSCKTSANFDLVIGQISKNLAKMLESSSEQSPSSPSTSQDDYEHQLDYVNERHLTLLRSSWSHLTQARRLDIRDIDVMAQHVREALDYLSRVVGHVTNEQVLDIIFRDFCIGK